MPPVPPPPVPTPVHAPPYIVAQLRLLTLSLSQSQVLNCIWL